MSFVEREASWVVGGVAGGAAGSLEGGLLPLPLSSPWLPTPNLASLWRFLAGGANGEETLAPELLQLLQSVDIFTATIISAVEIYCGTPVMPVCCSSLLLLPLLLCVFVQHQIFGI